LLSLKAALKFVDWRLAIVIRSFRFSTVEILAWFASDEYQKAVQNLRSFYCQKRIGFPMKMGGQYNKRFETDSPIVTVFGAP
jgi:hypothetical protein